MAVAKNVFSLLNLIWFIVIEENFSSVPVIQNAREKTMFIYLLFFSLRLAHCGRRLRK